MFWLYLRLSPGPNGHRSRSCLDSRLSAWHDKVVLAIDGSRTPPPRLPPRLTSPALPRTSLFSVVCALLSAVCDVNRQFVLTGILTAPGRSESRCLQNEIVEVFSGRKCAL